MTQRAWWTGLLSALMTGLLVSTVVQAQPKASGDSSAQVEPVGKPIPERVLRDADFGVTSRRFGLERTVEMYQWHRAGQGYYAGWSLEPVDSTGFAAGHANPGKFPLQSRQWRVLRVMLDGKPLAADAVARLGQWRAFRPDFSALPGNLSATFQPEGDGLGSAENPLDPQVGDLRVTWREWVLPPLAGRVVLRDGAWTLPSPAGIMAMPAEEGVQGSADATRRARAISWLALGLLVLLVIAIAHLRRRRKRASGSRSQGLS